MSGFIRLRLSIMMFLQFFIWGAWFVTMGTYLGTMVIDGENVFTPADIGQAYSTFALAAIISPLFIGMVADRFFSAEKILGVCHLVGAVMLYLTSTITDPATFYWSLLAYTLCYLPTIGLCNTVALDQIANPPKDFPPIRVFGTLGWIVAGLIIGFFEIEAESTPMLMAVGASVLLGIFSFMLPNVPPKSAGKTVSLADVLFLDALQLLKNRSFAIFAISSLFICIPLAFYYNFTNLFLNNVGMENTASKMTLGQVSEVLFMLILPFLFIRLGVKWVLVIGMCAWAARYLLFAWGNNETLVFMYYAGILLHGVCYDFFFVAGYIYTDKIAPPQIRASAQGFIILVTLGFGMWIGSYVSGYWVQANTLYDSSGKIVVGYEWTDVWMLPAVMALIVAVIFSLFFKNETDFDRAG